MRFLLSMFVVACALVACRNTKPVAKEIRITYAPETVEHFRIFPTAEVDLIGVNDIEQKRLEKMRIDEYFRPSNTLRNSFKKKTMFFSEEAHNEQVLEKKASEWRTWLKKRNSTSLVLLINLPIEANQDCDMRILTLPLQAYRWDDDVINVQITPAGFSLETPMNPED